MKGTVGSLLLLWLVQDSFWDRVHAQWSGPYRPPGHSFQPPGHSFVPPGRSFVPPGHAFRPPGPPPPIRGPGPGGPGPLNYNWYPYQPQQDNLVGDWVCHNQKTGDLMIIVADEGKGSSGQNGGWPGQNGGWPGQNGGWPGQNGYPDSNGRPNNGNYDNGYPNNGNSHNEAPNRTVDTGNVNNTNSPSRTDVKNSTATDEQPHHGGQGLIDVRIGDE